MTKIEVTANTGSDIFVILASTLFRHSSFVIRHSYHVCSGR